MRLAALQRHQSAHTAYMSAGNKHIVIFSRHHISCYIKNKIVTPYYDDSVFHFIFIPVKLYFYLFPCFHAFTALLYYTESIGSHKGHGSSCASGKRCSDNLSNLYSHIFLMLKA